MIPPPEYFAHLFQYVQWADLRQLESTRPIPDDEYFKDRGWSFGSIHKILLHQLSAVSIWLDRFEGVKQVWIYDDPQMGERESIEPAMGKIHQRCGAFFTSQTPQSLANVLHYSNMRGDPFAVPLWQLMVHVCNHSMHHRGQLNSMIKLAGAKPMTIDYAAYVTQQPRS